MDVDGHPFTSLHSSFLSSVRLPEKSDVVRFVDSRLSGQTSLPIILHKILHKVPKSKVLKNSNHEFNFVHLLLLEYAHLLFESSRVQKEANNYFACLNYKIQQNKCLPASLTLQVDLQDEVNFTNVHPQDSRDITYPSTRTLNSEGYRRTVIASPTFVLQLIADS